MALESIMQGPNPVTIQSHKQKTAPIRINDANTLCEPIRKQCVAIGPDMEISPNQMVCFMDVIDLFWNILVNEVLVSL